MSNIITLTSDWGVKDNYAAVVKGKILSYMPSAVIVDISHLIPDFDIVRAAFIVKNTYKNFPQRTIHIIGVDEEASIETPHIIVDYDEHYFIGADNGMFSLICDNQPDSIHEIEINQDSDYYTFPARDVFAKAACLVAQGKNLDDLGEKVDFKTKKLAVKPVIDGNTIRGNVVYIDSYENVITNISETLFKDKVKNKNFAIVLPRPQYRIEKISKSYKDVGKTDLVAFFNTLGLLEIAMNTGQAAGLLGLNIDSIIRIEFE